MTLAASALVKGGPTSGDVRSGGAMGEADDKWEQLYQAGFKPWDTGRPDSHLVRLVADGAVRPGRALDVGCGTGTNAIWLAERGFATTGIDVSPTALALARAKPGAERCTLVRANFFDARAVAGPFDFVFDLGCFHVFAEAAERAAFARRVFDCLDAGGTWLSLAGNADGRPVGMPTRSAAEIVDAVEPCFEILSLATIRLDLPPEDVLRAMHLPTGFELRGWSCLARKRRAAPGGGA